MKVEPIPEGYGAVTPFIIVKGAAQLLDFMRDAFGAEEMGRVVGEDGSIGHAETRIGDSVVMTSTRKKTGPGHRASSASTSKTATRCADGR
jgi:PhnB protein